MALFVFRQTHPKRLGSEPFASKNVIVSKKVSPFYTSLGNRAEAARELAYRIYTICERKKRAPEALAYNAVVQSMPEIARLAGEAKASLPRQAELFQSG